MKASPKCSDDCPLIRDRKEDGTKAERKAMQHWRQRLSWVAISQELLRTIKEIGQDAGTHPLSAPSQNIPTKSRLWTFASTV